MSVVVIGTSPFHDTSVAVGPFRSTAHARDAVLELECRGYSAETVPLQPVDEVGYVINDEGSE